MADEVPSSAVFALGPDLRPKHLKLELVGDGRWGSWMGEVHRGREREN